MEPEGPEIGPDTQADTGTVGQPIVQGENRANGEKDTEEKDLTGKMDPLEEKEPAGILEHTREKEHCENGEITGEMDPAEEKWSEKEHHTGPHPGDVPIPVPGIDRDLPDATVPPGKAGKKKRIPKKPVKPRPITDVHRKTEIFGASGNSFPEPAQVRRHTERNLKDPGFGIPYIAAEKVIHDLVCSLVERQDRISAGIMLDIKFMQEDIGILQDQMYKLKIVKGSAASAAGEKK